MSSLRSLLLTLAACFGLPWLLLIVLPVLNYQALQPEAYDKDRDGLDGHYPPATANLLGKTIYDREGCVQCHTQMIRPTQLALDGWRKGWGQDQDGRSPTAVRSNTLLDYLGEKQATLGVVRAGPDLANYGWRAPSREEIHRKLYAPRSIHEWSNMPALRALYTVRKIQGPVSDRAIRLTGADAPAEGFEVVPNAEAEELVNYLLSLKKDFPIPGFASAAAAAPAAKK